MSSVPAWAVADEPIPPTYPFPKDTDLNKLTLPQQKAYFRWYIENERYKNRGERARIMREVKRARELEERDRLERQRKVPVNPAYPDE